MGLLQLILPLLFMGCDDLIDIDPPKTEVVAESVFQSDANASAALIGMYSSMVKNNNILQVGLGTSLSADETDPLYIFDFLYTNFGNNNLTSSDFGASGYWGGFYQIIYQANSIIDNSTNSKGMTDAGRSKIIAEAKFVRALNFFYLVNMFGPVPLSVTSDVKVSRALERAPAADVYAQIISDLKEAEANLPADYTSYGGKRDRPVKSAATALLAKVYLYMGDYANAESKATEVINTADLYQLLPSQEIGDVFLKDSSESIFALNTATETGHFLTNEDNYYMYGFLYGTDGPAYVMTASLANAFEPGDARKTAWVGTFNYDGTDYFYAAKYKDYEVTTSPSEYSVVLRLSEMYLIRAEARAMQNNLINAKEDLNVIRQRALLTVIEPTSQSEILDAVIQERRVELFMEYGNRWFDLKRTGRVDALMSTLKPESWQSTDAFYPIPIDEIRKAPQLKQNDGY
ncbi:RagB/SusD family nutrient uptake outer membrane protein [Flavobacterium pectinovorum]|uniref:RagB/SusD family nutrient uptake outer membrane protein n=1 Tax=Flavobacterium pectinovorum TaxID=29533 RepID=UPI001FABA589|nr:RagB/SusD family nutrient uptake outer membrane protein [Flavobacterium pectinovorum]MCI9843591.1 RagB/SusD family nutrient uptake outer membrane protein [Flavobacterium pectinovorum]